MEQGGLASSNQDGAEELTADKEGCWQPGETLGNTQAARTDPSSLSELNSSRARGSNHSVKSLPGPPATCGSTQGSVVSWAESFETLLQDRVAVTYFTEFLKKEFSAENVYFWQACERFQQIPASDTEQLAQEARRIYDDSPPSHSVSPVNIDKQAWIGEDMLATPSPDMFRIQQLQIFNLMKFDSYARFVKSPLYQACLRAESQGQPLPDLRPHSRSSSPPPDLSKVSRRAFTVPDIKVYLVGKEQKALVLDQECSVLADQEVKLENRISFDLEISSLSKTIRITAKSTKRIWEALQPVLGKYGLSMELARLRRQGEVAALDLEELVSMVAAQKLILETPA
ncbi:PREDICTED: regulator of G-protein signaling 14, partial [Buceros rhinoceros silvestris]|uniref:regulator of G-protein signaling 14 n=1 Tax=Buceros rhinoceros silvestris TaxID=175836 RepID=UPI000528FC65